VNTIDEAVRVAHSLAKDGDFVILTPASASFDMFKNYREKGKAFEIAVKNIMQNCGSSRMSTPTRKCKMQNAKLRVVGDVDPYDVKEKKWRK